MGASTWVSEAFSSLVEFSNSVSGVLSLVALVGAAIAYALPWILPSPLRSLVGSWWTYGYFYQRGRNPIFYKELSVIRHFWAWPWILRFAAAPPSTEGQTSALQYKGFCWYRSIYVYFHCYEPIYDDTVFEIYRRVMDESHSDDFFVGVHIGKSYDDMVFQASTVLMTRKELVADDATISSVARRAREEAEFHRITTDYAVHDDLRGLLLIK